MIVVRRRLGCGAVKFGIVVKANLKHTCAKSTGKNTTTDSSNAREIQGYSDSCTKKAVYRNRPLQIAACIIGDEILNGKVKDCNSEYLAKKCFEAGFDLKKIEVIGDEITEISDSVQNLSKKYDVVITSGGIGPTHDDVTYEALANAFGSKLEYHPETIEKIKIGMQKMWQELRAQKNLNSSDKQKIVVLPDPDGSLRQKAAAKMGLLPKISEKIFVHKDSWVPVVVVNKNVFVFPGIPYYFRESLDLIIERLKAKQQPNTYKVEAEIKTETNVESTEAGGERCNSDSIDTSATKSKDLNANRDTMKNDGDEILKRVIHIDGYTRLVIGTRFTESFIAPILSHFQQKYAQDNVKIGSYPKHNDGLERKLATQDANVLITVTGLDKQAVEACYNELSNALDSH
ncbi:hypothetical protein AX774_g5831 [Zancudomyces culisetae]|uniref:MoaB/Mog domain-containing protein n=1 Tax=Zancudomyces culisetae TaxID=1213189 RepID=A0A1R1PI97_ZANCU|nr:hypothetical protein AX774_g5831 [Zancudomyces culisetae]|eukprot:OMH80725.1 hypothetical protein AX774_g5831 [Zancudomyces culisetae]